MTGDPVLPVFGSIKNIWVISDFVYFEVFMMNTIYFDIKFQAYLIESVEPPVVRFCSYDSLVDYNVFHVKKDKHKNEYVSVKYDIDDLLEEHMKLNNRLQR